MTVVIVLEWLLCVCVYLLCSFNELVIIVLVDFMIH